MKLTIKSQQQFLDEGFKSDYPYWYKGNKKDSDAKIKFHLVENLCGKSVIAVDIVDTNRGTILIEYDGRTYVVETWMFTESVKFNQFLQPKTIEIKGRLAKFYAVGFRFDCAHSELLLKDAVRLARWVLRVAKNAPKG